METVRSIEKEFGAPQNINVIHRRKLSKMDRLALFVTQRIGTMGFFFIIFAWTVLWLSWNVLAPREIRFDPYPAFVLWLFISNLIQIHLMPLIMIGQNIQGKHSQIRAEHDFATDKKAEKEIQTILLHLEKQDALMLEIIEKIEKMEEKILKK